MAAVGMAASSQPEARKLSSVGASSSSPAVPAQHQPRSCGGTPVRLNGRRQQPVGRALRAHRRLQRFCCTAFGSTDRFGSPDFMTPQGAGDAWDVLGLGQAMVDFSACVDDVFLEQLQVEKGSRRIITVEERAEILQQLDGSSYQVSAGGSLSNTLLALARLGRAEDGLYCRGPLRVAFDGILGSDVALSAFYSAQMANAGVSVLAQPSPNSCTGTVMVLTTPDANRTMLSYLGTPAPVVLDARLSAAIARSRLLVIEGYVWEMPDAVASISAALEVAHAHGTLVALTAGDAGLAARKRDDLWGALHAGVDLLFTNRSEAAALLGRDCSAREAALALGPHADMVVVTDGADGSCISALGSLQVVPPYWSQEAPLDTCGAGDAYAAGVLWAYLRGMGVAAMGRAGARVASQVISRQGATLSLQDAAKLAQELPLAESSPALSSLSSADMW